MSKTASRLSALDRKHAILTAATPVFARLGRAGATTRIIAGAAGVSEGLLFRHFPTKDVLYAQLERHCVQAQEVGHHLLDDAEPSTATLVMGVATLVQAVFPGIGERQAHDDTKRLVTASLLDDGRFATDFLDRHVRPWVDLFADCLVAARAAGDLHAGADAGRGELWFVHHLANTLHLVSLSGEEVIDYGMTREELTASAVLFLLRGLGLREEVIERHYDPGRLNAAITKTIRP
ncbi:TetR/AcrR family transcriptional regulator [Granulibacter bethesdensis]|nr:TetR/AcrR family transcriptional regulator [Granulibacter bethesdensis]